MRRVQIEPPPFLSEIVGEGLPAMDIQIIHHHVNLSRPGIVAHDRLQRLGKFWRGAVGGGQGEMPTGFRLHGAENIGGARKVKKLVREPNASTRGDQHSIDILSRPIRQVPRWIGSQVRACSLVRPVTSREQYSTWLGTPGITQIAAIPCSAWLLMLPRAHST